MTSSYPYPYSVLVIARHRWADLLHELNLRQSNMSDSISLWRLLLAPMGEEQARERADALAAAAELEWSSTLHARAYAELLRTTAEDLVEVLRAASVADRHNISSPPGTGGGSAEGGGATPENSTITEELAPTDSVATGATDGAACLPSQTAGVGEGGASKTVPPSHPTSVWCPACQRPHPAPREAS